MLAVSTATVMGMPDGAPLGACSNNLTPVHGNPANMAVGGNPFYVNTDDIGDYYVPEEIYSSE